MIYIEKINKLTFDETLIIILFILFFLLLLLIVIKLYKKNKTLEKKLDELEENNEELIYDKKKDNDIPLSNISLEEANKTGESNKIPKTNYILGNSKKDIVEENIEPVKKDKKDIETKNVEDRIINSSERKPYQKDVLKNIKAPTSPININNQSTIKELKMNLNDFIKKERKNGNDIKVMTSKDYKASSNSTLNYMEEVSKRLEKANDNNPIELTEYEKIQEEQAIISYQELMENKDKIYQLTDDEADIEFINELKNFRESLNSK